MQRTNIPANIAQEVFDSAPNAAQKGLSQFFTPPELAARLAAALPEHRPVLVDLNCGRGDLLQCGVRTAEGRIPNSALRTLRTSHLLGADIHNARKAEGRPINFIQSDLTLLYPLLVEVDWRADLFVLNPPWRLFWHRARLAALAESEVPAVRRAFAATEPGSPKDTIDSTLATLLIALDRCTTYGEGYLIGNNKTFERLLFAADAPYADLARHCWARVVIPGNPMTALSGCQWQEDELFETGVLYFAREHPHGPKTLRWGGEWPRTPDSRLQTPDSYPLPSRAHRLGASIRNAYAVNDQTLAKWNIVKEQVREIAGAKPKVPWNLWLDATGYIRTGLSSFETASRKLNKTAAARLHALEGKSPMQLVLQRADRDEVLEVAERGGWRVQPELLAAVRAAIVQYQASRAPLYPLSDIQRLGYTDEEDWLLCKKDLSVSLESNVSSLKSSGPTSASEPTTPDSRLQTPDCIVFRKGKRYPLRSQTITVTRKTQKPNLVGALEDFEYTGQELALFLSSAEWASAEGGVTDSNSALPAFREYSFLDARLRDDKETTVPDGRRCGRGAAAPPRDQPIDFTLQELVAHFDIPPVPDVATVNPEGYAHNLRRLEELEAAANSL